MMEVMGGGDGKEGEGWNNGEDENDGDDWKLIYGVNSMS